MAPKTHFLSSLAVGVLLSCILYSSDANAQTTSAAVEPAANKSWKAKVVFKSGAAVDLLVIAESTTSFVNLRNAFYNYLTTGGAQAYSLITPSGLALVIDWREVSAVHTWQE